MPHAAQMTPDPPVAALRCDSYELEEVRAAVRKAVDLVGGIGPVVRPGQTVLLKPNLLAPCPPEAAVTTHPTVVRAVAELVLEAGGRPLIGDSPAFYPLRAVVGPAGVRRVAEDLGLPIVAFTQPVTLENRWTPAPRRFTVDRQVLEADVVINLPKLKSHRQMRFTGAVKNLYGCMPGKRKAVWHALAANRDARFSEGVLAVALAARSELTVADAVLAMEGEGPRNGAPRHVGALVAGHHPVPVDAVLAHLIGAPAEDTLLLDAARRLGLGQTDLGRIEVLGDRLEGLVAPGFRLPELVGTAFSPTRLLRSAWISYRLRRAGA